jgi:CRISPR-associated endonuclease/helicase Cas3
VNSLAHSDFAAFFRAIWGFDPFPWQQDLLQRLATGRDPRRGYSDEPGQWPDVLDLPTGSGKTVALDIAVFHLALEALKGIERRAPLRIAFVVDRRLIVDDAFSRAERLRDALGWSLLDDQEATELEARSPDLADSIRRVRGEPVIKQASLRLRDLAGPDQPPLIARSLRGGAPREDDWARTPVQPTILCSTVDQVGSRLLFRGYGVSDRMKPIHAGLLGSDCLILLDEAHLSEPFRQTLEAIKHIRAPDASPFGFAVLTATPSVNAKQTFALGAEDYSNPTLSARITAAKPVRLVEITGKQGIDPEARRVEEICTEARVGLASLKTRIANPAVGIVVNRVARARAVFEQLKQVLGPNVVKLIIGPARAVDRDQRAHELAPIRTGRSRARSEMTDPLVVVATQTVEAGVDIDFDGLVTEAAPLDALRQRFGRLNRAGRDIAVEAVVLAHQDDIGSQADDPVYGDRIAKSWTKLQQLGAEANGVVDFGIDALRNRITREEAGALATPTVNAPVLLPAYADLWSHTSPIPGADPDVAIFLHGPDRSPATVQIVWRADIDERNDLRPAIEHEAWRVRLIELLKLVPPRSAEAVEVPLWAARAWLEQKGAEQADFSDAVEHSRETSDERATGRRVFCWAGEESERTQVVQARALRNGDLLVVPAAYGGCDEWAWNPGSNEPVIDVAEKSAWPYCSRRFAVRVTPALLAQGFRKPRDEERSSNVTLDAGASNLAAILAAHGDERATRLLDAVLGLDLPEELRSNLQALGRARRGRLERVFAYDRGAEEAPRGAVFVAACGITEPDRNKHGAGLERGADGALAAVPATESDDLSTGSDKTVSLLEHCNDVRAWAESFAIRAGLSRSGSDDVTLAAFLHDPGKADPRFQTFLAGGDPHGPDAAEPLAKSGQAHLPRGAWANAGLPDDWRHEALSVRLATLHPNFPTAHDRALVLWLIGSHHGYGRPLFPHADPLDFAKRHLELPPELGGVLALEGAPGPQSLAFDFEGRDWAQLFELLKEKYGIWGLAHLEAFVRLADHRASEEGAPPRAARPYQEAVE